jgi:hypothetical protein
MKTEIVEVSAERRDRLLKARERAFLDLEQPLLDLVRMMELAYEKMHETIGETEFDQDRNVVSHNLSDQTIDATIFAVGHVRDMIEAIKTKYDEAYSGGKGGLS